MKTETIKKGTNMIETKLYLGRGRKSGPDISDKNITEFLALCVTPYFDGFTMYHASGSWMGKPEATIVLEILHDNGTLESNRVQNIARSYCQVFDQDCVMRVDREVNSTLVGK